MHGTVNILIAVDTQSIQAQHNQHVYMMDDNYHDNSGEGGTELVTCGSPGDAIVWRAAAINQNLHVEIVNIHRSSAVDVFDGPPSKQDDGSWLGYLGNFGSSQETYQVEIKVGNETYTWDPYVKLNS